MTDSHKQSLSTEASKSKSARLLICDDQQLIRVGIRRALRNTNMNCEIGEAADGRQAVSMALEQRPDIIIMDLTMPEVDGIEATRQILAQAPGIAILGYSADPNEHRVQQMLAAGARGYVQKTGDYAGLIFALSRLLAGELFVSIQQNVDPHWLRPD